MEPLPDHYVYRVFEDRAAELRREADAFRLTRVPAVQHAALLPRARRFAARGLTALAAPRSAARASELGAVRRPAARESAVPSSAGPRSALQPCGC